MLILSIFIYCSFVFIFFVVSNVLIIKLIPIFLFCFVCCFSLLYLNHLVVYWTIFYIFRIFFILFFYTFLLFNFSFLYFLHLFFFSIIYLFIYYLSLLSNYYFLFRVVTKVIVLGVICSSILVLSRLRSRAVVVGKT